MRTIFLFCLLFPIVLTAQINVDSLINPLGFFSKKMTLTSGETIEYIQTERLPTQKGIIFYCTGSLPVPLFFDFKEKGLNTSLPLDVNSFRADYQLVVISKPGIPIVADHTTLNDRYCYVDEKGSYSEYYLQHNFSKYYMDTHNELIKKITTDHEYQKVIVMGHSQGAKVAANIGSSNNAITHVVYLSGNPLGRFDEFIRRKREEALVGAITDEEAQKEIENYYKKWEAMNADKESLVSEEGRGDSNKTWISFSEPTVDDLLEIDVPIFVGYGTRDITSRYCDLLPIDFIRAGKTNLTLKAYPGLDHSFFKVELDGRVNYEERFFNQVIEDGLEWLDEN